MPDRRTGTSRPCGRPGGPHLSFVEWLRTYWLPRELMALHFAALTGDDE